MNLKSSPARDDIGHPGVLRMDRGYPDVARVAGWEVVTRGARSHGWRRGLQDVARCAGFEVDMGASLPTAGAVGQKMPPASRARTDWIARVAGGIIWPMAKPWEPDGTREF